MKKSLILACAAMFALAPVASAQFVGMDKQQPARSASSTVSPSVGAKTGSFHISYIPYKIVNSEGGYSETNSNYKGFSAGIDFDSPLGTTPLLIEYGLSLDMAFAKDSEKSSGYSVEVKSTLLDLRAPVSLAYRFDIPGTSLSLMPLAGLDLGIFLLGKQKVSASYNGKTETDEGNLFENSDNKRFIFDFHVGARLDINKFFVEYRYEGPIVHLYNKDGAKTSIRRNLIGIGFYF